MVSLVSAYISFPSHKKTPTMAAIRVTLRRPSVFYCFLGPDVVSYPYRQMKTMVSDTMQEASTLRSVKSGELVSFYVDLYSHDTTLHHLIEQVKVKEKIRPDRTKTVDHV